jgi:hypothetical protein
MVPLAAIKGKRTDTDRILIWKWNIGIYTIRTNTEQAER